MNQLHQQFTDLINQNKLIVYGVCGKFTQCPREKKELFQDSIIAAWEGFPKFRGDSKFSTWLYNVAKHVCINWMRAAKSRTKWTMSNNPLYEIVDYNEYLKDHQYKDRILRQVVEQLTDTEKNIVALYIDGCSHEQIASILQVPLGTHRVRFKRIKDRMKKYAIDIIKEEH